MPELDYLPHPYLENLSPAEALTLLGTAAVRAHLPKDILRAAQEKIETRQIHGNTNTAAEAITNPRTYDFTLAGIIAEGIKRHKRGSRRGMTNSYTTYLLPD